MLKGLFDWFISPRFRILKLIAIVILIITTTYALRIGVKLVGDIIDPRSETFIKWSRGNTAERKALLTVQREACSGAPFILPTDGFIGLLFADPRGPYSNSNPHQGIDIFSPDRDSPGLVPVYAAFDGYISREVDWRSSLIQRIPEDPLNPGEQIWLYYTHMADIDGNDFIEEAFPPGAKEVFVKQGTPLGFTGNYNGNSPRGVWVHLHFSIVNDDGSGNYTNELDFQNTIDPSPYLGMPLNYHCAPQVPACSPEPVCS